jgi:hypothetical protein
MPTLVNLWLDRLQTRRASAARACPHRTAGWYRHPSVAFAGGGGSRHYLSDARPLRNRLDHTDTTVGVKQRSRYFTRCDKTELRSMTLMLAEGMLQAAQDVAYLTSSAPAAERDIRLWSDAR